MYNSRVLVSVEESQSMNVHCLQYAMKFDELTFQRMYEHNDFEIH